MRIKKRIKDEKMAKMKKIIGLLLVIIGIWLYASQSTARSLYLTKMDASSDYRVIGQSGEKMVLAQSFVAEADQIGQVTFSVKGYNPETMQTARVAIMTKDLKTTVVSVPFSNDHVLFNTAGTAVTVTFNTVKLTAGDMYQLVITDGNGDMFYSTQSRYPQQKLMVNDQFISGALVAKVVYNGLHMQTFLVLLGLIGFILLFMYGMVKLFR